MKNRVYILSADADGLSLRMEFFRRLFSRKPKLGFVHHVKTKNVGDLVCAPYQYFPFADFEVFDIEESFPSCDVLIFGGGAIGYVMKELAGKFPEALKICWGVGDTVHGAKETGPVPSGFLLYGSREWRQSNSIYVPCVSCMSPLFDRTYPIRHKAVLYLNADRKIADLYPVSVSELPSMNNQATFDSAVEFLGSAEIVVTNSYHGAYWATLLGRRAVLYKPYSSKFFSYKHPPAIAADGDWRLAAQQSKSYPTALIEAREANKAFYLKLVQTLPVKYDVRIVNN